MNHFVICPTITAFDSHEYRVQMERVAPFTKRVHIDLMDGEFTPTRSPGLDHTWWPHELVADIHLMYQRPEESLQQLIKLKPHMVIIHAEAQANHMHFAAQLHAHDIEAGLAILADTSAESVYQIIHSFDQILVFSGDLGRHGGVANLKLLDKVHKIQTHHPDAEIAWDGGINDQNARQLVQAGVRVLNVGGFIQDSSNPQQAYHTLESSIYIGKRAS